MYVNWSPYHLISSTFATLYWPEIFVHSNLNQLSPIWRGSGSQHSSILSTKELYICNHNRLIAVTNKRLNIATHNKTTKKANELNKNLKMAIQPLPTIFVIHSMR